MDNYEILIFFIIPFFGMVLFCIGWLVLFFSETKEWGKIDRLESILSKVEVVCRGFLLVLFSVFVIGYSVGNVLSVITVGKVLVAPEIEETRKRLFEKNIMLPRSMRFL